MTPRAASAAVGLAALWLPAVVAALPSLAARGVGTQAAPLLAAPGVAVLSLVVHSLRRPTATREMLEEAERARAGVELILSSVSDGVWVRDRQWRLRYVDTAALRYLQRSREEMLGASLWALFPGLREAEFGARFEHAMRSGETIVFAAAYAPLGAFYEMRCYPFEGGLAAPWPAPASLSWRLA